MLLTKGKKKDEVHW